MSGFRKQQVESALKRIVGKVLAHQLSDPRIVGMISVTHVDVSPDLHNASVYVSVLPEKFERRTLQGLQHATRYIHSLVCKGVAMKSVPHLEFRLDKTMKKEAAIFDAIRRGIEHETPPPDAGDQDADEPADQGSEKSPGLDNADDTGESPTDPEDSQK